MKITHSESDFYLSFQKTNRSTDMIIGEFYDGIEIHRNEKIIIVKFLKPHRVISTCRANGGLHDGFDLIYNHQSCEPVGHMRKSHKLATRKPYIYLKQICEMHGISANCASLGTAANMNCAAIKSAKFRNLEVIAICTGGVESNAGRAGDHASFYEAAGEFEFLGKKKPKPCGTINTILCINQELTKGAMVRAVMMATEAKTTVLQELNVGSCYSDGLATGTGTDQIAIACVLTGKPGITSAGKHTKLGELIGISVRKAIAETLKLQNSMPPESRCSVSAHIKRFGADIEGMKAGIAKFLPKEKAELFEKNFICVDRDPITVAAAASLVHLRDELIWKILPKNCLPEIFSTYGAHLSAAVSGKYKNFISYKKELDQYKLSAESISDPASYGRTAIDNTEFLEFIYFCISAGFKEKWDDE